MDVAAKLFKVSVLVMLVAVSAHAQKPCLTASKFGPNDQIGNLNYVTEAKTLAATRLVTKGKTYRQLIRRALSRLQSFSRAKPRASRLVQPKRHTMTT
jgi:hypothetical protein